MRSHRLLPSVDGRRYRDFIQPIELNTMLNDIIPQGETGAMFQQAGGGWTSDYDNTAYAMYHTGEKWNPYDSAT